MPLLKWYDHFINKSQLNTVSLIHIHNGHFMNSKSPKDNSLVLTASVLDEQFPHSCSGSSLLECSGSVSLNPILLFVRGQLPTPGCGWEEASKQSIVLASVLSRVELPSSGTSPLASSPILSNGSLCDSIN